MFVECAKVRELSISLVKYDSIPGPPPYRSVSVGTFVFKAVYFIRNQQNFPSLSFISTYNSWLIGNFQFTLRIFLAAIG